MYAWSRFAKTKNEWGRVTEWIEPGDEISQSDLDVNDDEWKYLQDSGAVRKEEYPEVGPGESPAEYYRSNPDKAPEIDVDETTPSGEAIRKQDTALSSGLKLPGATEAEDAAKEQSKAEEKNRQSSAPNPTTGGSGSQS